jgi:TldD protein
MRDRKLICTTDGARAEIGDCKGAFSLFAVARDGSNVSEASEVIGCTGGWGDLFRSRGAEQIMETATSRAIRLLKADFPKGERATVVLDPGIVGLIAHEAIGHTVEADLVMAGAVTKDKIGTRVASDLVTLADSGHSVHEAGAGGVVLVDDEGVVTGRTVVIENGVLRSYLHSRETAHVFGVTPTGNARAFEYSDEPLIRMRNTYIEPGASKFEEMIAGVKRGYLLKGSIGGQADVNGEFMFGVQEAFRINDGKVGTPLRGVTISGKAFEVLSTVDAVSDKFEWGLGGGMCGKGQPARVDAGGAYIRCVATVGGRQ